MTELPRIRRKTRMIVISVEGYKSIRDETKIELRPLTIIAGTNSSGKSSFMQALLLLKQTLEAQFDPGALLLNGPNVALTSADQMFSKGRSKSEVAKIFSVGLQFDRRQIRLSFQRASGQPVGLESMQVAVSGEQYTVREGIVDERLLEVLRPQGEAALPRSLSNEDGYELVARASRNRCFLFFDLEFQREGKMYGALRTDRSPLNVAAIRTRLLEVIHVPGLRGNPERVYPRSAFGGQFPGTFEQYVASIIHKWQDSKLAADQNRLAMLNSHLEMLGLTWKIAAKAPNDTSVELLVGRLPHAQRSGAHDLVNIADVGFGVSQTLPVLVALVAARPGQIVYLEQPEIHLHPRAQTHLAAILAEHAERGVIVVTETHSSLLIRGVQTAIATEKIRSRDVALHWFTRSPEDGFSQVSTAQPDPIGRFYDWPADFDDVAMEADMAYLDAADRRQDELEAAEAAAAELDGLAEGAVE